MNKKIKLFRIVIPMIPMVAVTALSASCQERRRVDKIVSSAENAINKIRNSKSEQELNLASKEFEESIKQAKELKTKLEKSQSKDEILKLDTIIKKSENINSLFETIKKLLDIEKDKTEIYDSLKTENTEKIKDLSTKISQNYPDILQYCENNQNNEFIKKEIEKLKWIVESNEWILNSIGRFRSLEKHKDIYDFDKQFEQIEPEIKSILKGEKMFTDINIAEKELSKWIIQLKTLAIFFKKWSFADSTIPPKIEKINTYIEELSKKWKESLKNIYDGIIDDSTFNKEILKLKDQISQSQQTILRNDFNFYEIELIQNGVLIETINFKLVYLKENLPKSLTNYDQSIKEIDDNVTLTKAITLNISKQKEYLHSLNEKVDNYNKNFFNNFLKEISLWDDQQYLLSLSKTTNMFVDKQSKTWDFYKNTFDYLFAVQNINIFYLQREDLQLYYLTDFSYIDFYKEFAIQTFDYMIYGKDWKTKEALDQNIQENYNSIFKLLTKIKEFYKFGLAANLSEVKNLNIEWQKVKIKFNLIKNYFKDDFYYKIKEISTEEMKELSLKFEDNTNSFKEIEMIFHNEPLFDKLFRYAEFISLLNKRKIELDSIIELCSKTENKIAPIKEFLILSKNSSLDLLKTLNDDFNNYSKSGEEYSNYIKTKIEALNKSINAAKELENHF
ncbi:hypothetical protein DMC14_002810 [Metamycoplasma phocicerebrale]|uniref:Lipoprotein n=1 Tax=Metamycoplasma phocicerebrale TaxID=142649 RepID=A0A3T0TUB7_9BACT|nr:hypothetical protein [Metamycoplasma phocicerebrale]AZZ65697.1 hypothetical protein DMC14_002810 [Metamycoplasma phocicerebrale]